MLGGDPMENQNESQTSHEKKPFYKKWWFYVIVALIVVSIIGALTGGLADHGNGDSNVVTDDLESPAENYFIGDKVAVNDLEYTVKQVVDTKVFIIGENIVKTENNFIKITFAIKNTGNDSIMLWSSNLKLYRGEAKYQSQYESSDLTFHELAPGLTKEFFVIFEVPDKTTEFDYLLEVKNGNATKKITLKDRQ